LVGVAMKVLVTGSKGFIGRRVSAKLWSGGHVPVPFDPPLGDVRNLDELNTALSKDGVGAVINLAGVLGTGEVFGREANAVDVNIRGAVNVFDAAWDCDVSVVQIGTGHRGQPNPYAITKACAEDIGLARAAYCNERIVVVRAFHAYGPGQKMCAPHGSGVRKIVPSFVCRALSGMDLEVYGSGNQVIDLVYVDDVAQALVDALRAEPGSIIEAGTGKPTTVLDAARDIIAACDSPSGIVHAAQRAGEPPNATVVASSPVCPNLWPYGLAETVAWYRKRL
jgi:UDP-glucose 4-epimerase